MPYRRHCMKTIENIIAGDMDGVDVDGSAIRRVQAWWKARKLYLDSVIASLGEKYEVVISPNAAPREIVRAVVNAHLWPSTRSAYSPG